MADGGYPNKIKRPCLEDVTLSMGPRAHPSTLCAELQVPTLSMNPSSAAVDVAGQSLLLENNPMENNLMNGSVMGSPFGVSPTAEMGLKGPAVPYYEKVNSMPAVDQELQDLLEELTKIQEPSSNELDLEKILGSKPEEPLVLHHPQAPLGTPPKLPVQMPHMESLGSGKEFASSCSQVTATSLPILPSSTGISYSIPSTSKQMVTPSSSTAQAQAKNQAQAMLPVTLPPLSVPQWHHAHQLKALAASKQGSATKQQGTNRAWSGLPPPGLSPPYLPVPSPHPPPPPPPPPPFSPQNFTASCMSSNSLSGSTLQGSPNALLSGMAPGSAATLGPQLPYAPAKLPSLALNQQPQFSPQSSLLANLVSSNSKSPQGHLMSALPTSNPGPSPPYRPEKLSSPSLPQQSFTQQYSLIRSLTPTSNLLSQQPPPPPQQQQANAIFKPMTSNQQPKTLSMLMQQGLASSSPEAPEPFTFGNTKPLSHFVSEPGPQKMPSMPATSRQPSLLHYLPQATPAQASSATASSTATATLQLQQQPQQPDHSPFLLQQMMQQPQRFQRSAASDSMSALPRQQEKQRSGLMAMTPKQRSTDIAQKMSQFQAVQEQVTSKCSQTKASPPSSQHMMPPRTGLLQNNLNPGIMPPTRHQNREGMGVISPTPRKQQGTFSSAPHFSIPSGSCQNPLGSLGSVCQRPQSPKAIPPGVPLPRFCPSPLGSQPLSPHQLSLPSVPEMPTMFSNAAWATATTVSKESPPGRVANSVQQHFDSNSIFAKAPMRALPVAPACPSQQALGHCSHVALGVGPGQKVSATLAKPSFSLLGNQGLRQSPVRGPVPVLSTTRSLQQGMASFAPMSPIQGIEPPSYVAATASAAAASAITASQSPGPFDRLGPPPELPPDDFLPLAQPPPTGLISTPDCGEVDFLEALLKGSSVGPTEDWVCNLRLIDDILEQQAAAQNATVPNAGQLTQGAGEL